MTNITNTKTLAQAFKSGPYAWPGGYTVEYITDDGACLCHDCVKSEYASIVWSINNDWSDGWRVVAKAVVENYGPEDGDVYCDHCNANLTNGAD